MLSIKVGATKTVNTDPIERSPLTRD